jgi:hypothetical protein
VSTRPRSCKVENNTHGFTEKLPLLLERMKERRDLQYHDLTSFIELVTPEEVPEDINKFCKGIKQYRMFCG